MDDRMLDMIPRIDFPAAVFQGRNALFYLRSLKGKKLIVSSETAWRIHGEKMSKYAGEHDRLPVSGEPGITDVERLHAKIGKGEYETVIGFGGGSAMDLAKMSRIVDTGAGLVLIPTTSGTGSESSRYAIIKNENGEKEPVSSPRLVPDTVLLDPSFTFSLPEKETINTTMDALSHSIEGIASKMGNPMSEALAVVSINMIKGSLEKVLADPADVDGRTRLQNAGFISGLVQSSASVGLIHSFANCLGPELGLSHGSAVGAFMLPVMRFSLEKTNKYEKLRPASLFAKGNIADRLESFVKESGFVNPLDPSKLRSLATDKTAERILADVCTKTNPYKPTVDDIKEIMEAGGSR